jgi:hypothetical protein
MNYRKALYILKKIKTTKSALIIPYKDVLFTFSEHINYYGQ